MTEEHFMLGLAVVVVIGIIVAIKTWYKNKPRPAPTSSALTLVVRPKSKTPRKNNVRAKVRR